MKKLLLILLLFNPLFLLSQEQKVEWMSFEQLEDSLQIDSKLVFIYFYADWCVYCKKMERNAFKDPEVVKLLNTKFFPVKMDANSSRSIDFDGRTFVNAQVKTRRNPIHQLPLLLASRKEKPFALPALLLLDKDFRIQKRSFEYLTSKDLKKFLTIPDKKS
jgi:thiol-disulfide isomerase/thioredoxin